MEQVLVVSSSKKGCETLTELLKKQSFKSIIVTNSGSQARRTLREASFDLLVINAPLSDELGYELALMAVETTNTGVLLLVKNDLADEARARVEDFGVFVVTKPLSPEFFYQALKLVQASRRRLIGLKEENTVLQKQIQDIRLVNRAKCVLIQYLSMTEPQAHKYIERQAMDQRASKSEVAQGILRTYESEG